MRALFPTRHPQLRGREQRGRWNATGALLWYAIERGIENVPAHVYRYVRRMSWIVRLVGSVWKHRAGFVAPFHRQAKGVGLFTDEIQQSGRAASITRKDAPYGRDKVSHNLRIYTPHSLGLG